MAEVEISLKEATHLETTAKKQANACRKQLKEGTSERDAAMVRHKDAESDCSACQTRLKGVQAALQAAETKLERSGEEREKGLALETELTSARAKLAEHEGRAAKEESRFEGQKHAITGAETRAEAAEAKLRSAERDMKDAIRAVARGDTADALLDAQARARDAESRLDEGQVWELKLDVEAAEAELADGTQRWAEQLLRMTEEIATEVARREAAEGSLQDMAPALQRLEAKFTEATAAEATMRAALSHQGQLKLESSAARLERESQRARKAEATAKRLESIIRAARRPGEPPADLRGPALACQEDPELPGGLAFVEAAAVAAVHTGQRKLEKASRDAEIRAKEAVDAARELWEKSQQGGSARKKPPPPLPKGWEAGSELAQEMEALRHETRSAESWAAELSSRLSEWRARCQLAEGKLAALEQDLARSREEASDLERRWKHQAIQRAVDDRSLPRSPTQRALGVSLVSPVGALRSPEFQVIEAACQEATLRCEEACERMVTETEVICAAKIKAATKDAASPTGHAGDGPALDPTSTGVFGSPLRLVDASGLRLADFTVSGGGQRRDEEVCPYIVIMSIYGNKH